MKLKGIDILNISEVFSFLATKEVNLNTAVTIVNNIKILSVPKQVLDEKRNKIVADCALKENGHVVTNDDGSVKELINKEEFNKRMSTLFSEDVDVDELKSIDMKSLSNVTISPQMLAVLMSFNLVTEE
ncbi:MAG: hypothetical protein EGP79_13890 [Roseburia intestinalis]|nr:hypothetical protein [Roseburia intestinalis]